MVDSVHECGSSRSIDWNEVAARVEAAKDIVSLLGTSAFIKFDGEREDGEIYTVLIYGKPNEDLVYIAETNDLSEGLAEAFPIIDATRFSDLAALGAAMREFDALARQRCVVSLQIFWEAGALGYSLIIESVDRAFDYVRCTDNNLIGVIAAANALLGQRMIR